MIFGVPIAEACLMIADETITFLSPTFFSGLYRISFFGVFVSSFMHRNW